MSLVEFHAGQFPTEAGVPAERDPAVSRRLASRHQQRQGERILKGDLRQFRGRRESKGRITGRERAAEAGVGVSLRGQSERMFARTPHQGLR